MRVHTFIGILFALAGAVCIAYLTQQNSELIRQSFRLTDGATVPLYVVLMGTFLVGFLPVVALLVVETLKQDLASRRQRRFEREARSRQSSYRRAVDLQEDGQWRRAAEALEGVLADQPEDFDALFRYGEALRQAGRVEEALEVHRRASVLYPQSVGVLYQLHEDYAARQEPAVAREIADRILRDFPGLGLRVLKQRRDAAVAAGDWAEAQRLQEALTALSPESASGAEANREETLRRALRFQRGEQLLEQGQLAEAAQFFADMLAEWPRFRPALLLHGEALMRTGDAESARRVWRKAWQETGSALFLQRLEDSFIEGEQPMEAIEFLHRTIAASRDQALPRLFLAKLYARLEMHQEALRALGPVAEQVKGSPQLLYLSGRLHERRGDHQRAWDAYRSSLERLQLETNRYRCQRCDARLDRWQARCDGCGEWDSIDLDLGIEAEFSDETTLLERPVWPVHGER